MPPGAPPRSHRILCLFLLAAGLIYWLCVFNTDPPDPNKIIQARFRLLAIFAALVVALAPNLRRRVNDLIQWLNATLASRPVRTAIVITIFVAVYFLLYDLASRELLFIKLNDEHAYMIQAQMLARGRLWMPPYPSDIAPFFDALALINDRVYAPMYFPGTALALVPFVWLNLPFWLMPLLCASAAAGLLYVLISGLFDPFRGLLAVFVLLSLASFRDVAHFLLSEAPFLAAELILLLAWIRWRRKLDLRWTLLIGIATGFAAITRPLDAVCIAFPVGFAIIWQLRTQPRRLLAASSMIALGALPFILLLLIQCIGVTGHWNKFAESSYNDHNFPASPLGFHQITPGQIPQNVNAIKRQWLHNWVLPKFAQHTPKQAILGWYSGLLRVTLERSLPDPILCIILPVALLGLHEIRRLVLFTILALFLFGYALYLFFLDHYVVAIMPSMICLLLTSGAVIQKNWPNSIRLKTFIPVCILTLSLTAIWPIKPIPPVLSSDAADQRPANALLANLPKLPAVVLFRFDPKVASAHDDPVYNDTVAWPDDAPIIRARDLGPDQDRAIYRYYADRQPNRVFYIYDPDRRAAGQNPLSAPLGTAAELAASSPKSN